MEPAAWESHVSSGLFILAMISCYSFGIWSRSFVLPANPPTPFKTQLIAGVPMGLLVASMFGKAAYDGLSVASPHLLFDGAYIAGQMIILGMLSRESLDRILREGRSRLHLAGT
jgi:hypothetical protein